MSDQSEVAAHEALYDTYFSTWNRKDFVALADLFAFPLIIGGGGRAPVTVPDAAAYIARMEGMLVDMESRGWAISILDQLHVGLMAGDTGCITVHYHRDRADGSLIEAGTSNYLTRKIGGAWKIIGMLAP
jgi:hypothetical protein